MRLFKWLLTAAMLVSVPAMAAQAFASDADVIREAKDRAEIEQLEWHYIRALDTLDAAAYPSFFTEDGSICCENNHTYRGRAEIRKLIDEVIEKRAQSKAKGEVVPTMYHPVFNFHIEFRSKDHAHVDSYWFTAMAMKPPNGEPRISLVGRCEDEVVRVNGKWLFKSRNLFP